MPEHHALPIKVYPRRERSRTSLGNGVDDNVMHVSNRKDTGQQAIGENDAAISGAGNTK